MVKDRSTFAVLTCLVSLGVKSRLPQRSSLALRGTGLVLSCQPSSAHLDMAKVSQGGAAPTAATLPALNCGSQKVVAPLEMSCWSPWTMSRTQTNNWMPLTKKSGEESSAKWATSPGRLLPPYIKRMMRTGPKYGVMSANNVVLSVSATSSSTVPGLSRSW